MLYFFFFFRFFKQYSKYSHGLFLLLRYRLYTRTITHISLSLDAKTTKTTTKNHQNDTDVLWILISYDENKMCTWFIFTVQKGHKKLVHRRIEAKQQKNKKFTWCFCSDDWMRQEIEINTKFKWMLLYCMCDTLCLFLVSFFFFLCFRSHVTLWNVVYIPFVS